MKKLILYARSYFLAVCFSFVLFFIVANFIRLFIFALNCLDDCNNPNPLTLLKTFYNAFFTSLVAGIHGIVTLYDELKKQTSKSKE